jgi:hypothetical protein
MPMRPASEWAKLLQADNKQSAKVVRQIRGEVLDEVLSVMLSASSVPAEVFHARNRNTGKTARNYETSIGTGER